MIIRKELPLSKEQIFSKYGRYYINDNYLRFWFCYIYPNIASLGLKKHQSVLKELDDTNIKKILTPTYCEFIKNLIHLKPERYLGFVPNKVGSWWDNNGNNIDLIAYDTKKIVFMMIVWESKEVAVERYNELKEMASHFKTPLKREYIIISKNTYFEILEGKITYG